MRRSRYTSETRLEEAVIVKRIIIREESKPKQVNDGIELLRGRDIIGRAVIIP